MTGSVTAGCVVLERGAARVAGVSLGGGRGWTLGMCVFVSLCACVCVCACVFMCMSVVFSTTACRRISSVPVCLPA